MPLYVVPDQAIHELIGFRFHNGCLAVGTQGRLPRVGHLLESLADQPAATLVIAHELNNTENLGAIMRIAAGFGAAGLVLGPRTADPFYRQAIRVSMGAVFSLQIAESDDLPADLTLLRAAGFEVAATVTHADALPLPRYRPAPRRAIVLGSEAHGLDAATVAACSPRPRISLPSVAAPVSARSSIARWRASASSGSTL